VTLETTGGFQLKSKEKQQKPQCTEQSNSAYTSNKQSIPEQHTQWACFSKKCCQNRLLQNMITPQVREKRF